MQLAGEEVDAEVAVLSRGGRGGDANNLARTALEDDDIAEANVVAGNGDSVGSRLGLGGLGGRALCCCLSVRATRCRHDGTHHNPRSSPC